MILSTIAIALLLQAAPASVSGTVLQNGTGEPLANVRVSLAQTDAALGAFAQMVAGDRPPGEITLSGEILASMGQMMALGAGPNDDLEAKAFAALPIADIAELTVAANGEVSVVYKSAPPVMTDAQGHFTFNNVRPGTYKLQFASNGYARQSYGQRTPGGSGVPIVVVLGQSRNDIVMRMSQVSALGGRVADTEGHPVAGVPVQLIRFAYDETGKRSVQRVSSAKTDDRGQFRMFYLSPGHYYLSAGNQAGPENELDMIMNNAFGGNLPPVNRIPEKYALSYYPGTPDVRSATAIDVPSGVDMTGIDMYLKVQQLFRVKGSLIDPRNGQPPRNASISLNLQNPDPLGGSYVDFGDGQPVYNSAEGTFEMRNVVPGAYILSAELPNPNQPRPPTNGTMTPEEQRAFSDAMMAASAAAPRAVMPVTVVNADVEGLQLRVGTTGSITGTIRMDPSANAQPPEFSYMRVSMRPVDGSAPASEQQYRPAKADGTFRVDGLWPGEYQLALSGLPPGFYLKEARLGEIDLTTGSWRYNGSDAGVMNIVISPSTGNVDGVVSDAQGRAVAGARVVLIPERSRERKELFRPAVSDPNGRFSLTGVAPGDYKLVAWEAIEPFAFFDPDLLKQADDAGKAVHVTESSKQTVNVSAFQ